MRKKHFFVVTYDISDDKRRAAVVKLLENLGARVNYSVFECMLTDVQYRGMCAKLDKLVQRGDDWVNVYPLCTECYARIRYVPDRSVRIPDKIVVI